MLLKAFQLSFCHVFKGLSMAATLEFNYCNKNALKYAFSIKFYTVLLNLIQFKAIAIKIQSNCFNFIQFIAID